jgi:hypothetical protein
MSFSEGIPKGKILDEDKGEFDGYRGNYEICECSYPNCHSRKIAREEDAVFWNGAHIAKQYFENNLSPLAKLAVIANPTKFKEEHGYYYVTISMHAGCAAEWGMHLIKDAIQSDNVNRTLRKDK